MPPEFPFAAVRDLLGILRAMWAAEKAKPSPATVRMKRIKKMADELKRAATMAHGHDPGTAPHDRAMAMADAVILQLMDLADVTTPLEPVLTVAGDRVRGRKKKPAEREIKWAVGRKRG